MEIVAPIDNLDRIEISKVLFKMPFNTSLVGYSMLVEAIGLAMPYSSCKINLTKCVYEPLSKIYNINSDSVEKNIRGALISANGSNMSHKLIEYPNVLIKNALIECKPKSFICAICELIRHNKLVYSIN